MTGLRTLFVIAFAALATGCASTQQAEQAAAGGPGATSCDSFLIYTMCMTDRAQDGDVDFVYFADDMQIFMYRPDEDLPSHMPLHKCARPINAELQGYGNALMYEDLSLMEEMGVKRKLLVNFMAAKMKSTNAMVGDSTQGISENSVDEEFASDDFDWGED